jgi:hypothetical protein
MCWMQILEEEPRKKTTITLGGVSLLICVLVADSGRGAREKTNITLGGVSLLIYVLVADSGRGATEKDEHKSWWKIFRLAHLDPAAPEHC